MNQAANKRSGQHSYSLAVLSHFCFHSNMLHSLSCPAKLAVTCEPCYQTKDSILIYSTVGDVCPSFVYVCACVENFLGGHDNFRKMIDEAEPLGYPVVVKNARGHRGKTISPVLPVIHSGHNAITQNPYTATPSLELSPLLYEILWQTVKWLALRCCIKHKTEALNACSVVIRSPILVYG